MRKFKVFANGKNYFIRIDEAPPVKHGYFTTVFVNAPNAEQAEGIAVDLLKSDPKLRDVFENESSDPPFIIIESVEEVESFEGNKIPRLGLAWYVEGS